MILARLHRQNLGAGNGGRELCIEPLRIYPVQQEPEVLELIGRHRHSPRRHHRHILAPPHRATGRIHQDLTDPVTSRLHRDVPVGGIRWIASPGGPTCYEAKLDTDPDDRTGTGATPLVALQQLAATQAS